MKVRTESKIYNREAKQLLKIVKRTKDANTFWLWYSMKFISPLRRCIKQNIHSVEFDHIKYEMYAKKMKIQGDIYWWTEKDRS
jgi:hypothetical protein